MNLSNAPIISKPCYTDLEQVVTSLCKASFFFKTPGCHNIELLCPCYISGDFFMKHEKALKYIVLITHPDKSVLYNMVSNIHNKGPIDRIEYLVYRAVAELKELEEQNK